MRVFISIDLPKEVTEKIKEIQDKLPSFVGKKIEPEHLHLTLKFLGEKSEDEVKEIIAQLKKVHSPKSKVTIDKVGVFSSEEIRIVWLHIESINELQKAIDQTLEEINIEPEERFMSHLTIARVKEVQEKHSFLEKINTLAFNEISFMIHQFRLVKSTLTALGPIYETLEKFALR